MLVLSKEFLKVGAYKKTGLAVDRPFPHSRRQKFKILYDGVLDKCQVKLTVTTIRSYGDAIDCSITLRCLE